MSEGIFVQKEEMVKQTYSSITIWKIVRFDTCPSRTLKPLLIQGLFYV